MKPDLFDEFPYTTAKEWLSRISQDLKARNPQEMLWSPDGNLRINPFVHAEDVSVPVSGLKAFGNWQIGESFVVTDERASNVQILSALAGGAESIQVSCTDNVHWDQLLSGVELPYIHLHVIIIGDRERAFNEFLSFTGTRFSNDQLRVTWCGPGFPAIPEIRFCSAPYVGNDIVDELQLTICSALDSAQWNAAHLGQCDLSVHTGMYFLLEIARLRALRILWSNVADALRFSDSTEFAIEAHTRPCKPEDDPNSHMIKSTIMGLAAILGGADRVYINAAVGIEQDAMFYRHVARNVHHILRYESKLTELSDPLAGAYYVDHLTKDLVRRVWDLLLKRIESW